MQINKYKCQTGFSANAGAYKRSKKKTIFLGFTAGGEVVNTASRTSGRLSKPKKNNHKKQHLCCLKKTLDCYKRLLRKIN